MTSLSTDFTEKLFADYKANAKYGAIENAVTHNGLLKSIETRQSEVENDFVFSIDLTKDEVSNQKLQVVAGCLRPLILSAIN